MRVRNGCVENGEKKRNCYRLLSVLWFNQMNVVCENKWIAFSQDFSSRRSTHTSEEIYVLRFSKEFLSFFFVSLLENSMTKFLVFIT